MALTMDPEVKARFPNLKVLTSLIENVTVRRTDPQLEAFKEEVIREVRSRYNTDSLKDEPVLRAYRDFFWQIKVDPTKTRPAAEALIRRIASGNPLPRINTFVDAYNLASIKTEVAIAAFDTDRLCGNLRMRYAVKGERFLGIGMNKPLMLRGGEIVISDEKKLVAIYPYRDAEECKVTEATRTVILLFCGVPGISLDKLRQTMRATHDVITRFCGGTPKSSDMEDMD